VTPTWYDVLGVAPDASTDEIRTAWRAAIADLDPGERRFRSLNEAAEVLLDEERRAAYDEQLAPEPADEPEPVDEPVEEPDPEPVSLEKPGTETPAEPAPVAVRRGVPGWVLVAMTVLVAVALVAAGYLMTQPSDAAIADATSDAQGAAERAVVTILSYDYREMDQDQKAAGALMTADYRKKYDALFAQLKANAPSLKVAVTCDVIASGIVRSGDDRVQVLVFVNRPTTRADKEQPEVYRDQVRVTMVRSGSDWLVDDMQTSPTAA
jgi:Mce-associated membrane protein